MFKVCIRISQEICGGVQGKVFFGLTAIGFIKLSRMARGSINHTIDLKENMRKTLEEILIQFIDSERDLLIGII